MKHSGATKSGSKYVVTLKTVSLNKHDPMGNFWDEKNLNKDIKIVVNENLEFDEFKKKMKVYLDRSKYPDIND